MLKRWRIADCRTANPAFPLGCFVLNSAHRFPVVRNDALVAGSLTRHKRAPSCHVFLTNRVESRKGARPGPTGSRLFPFPAHQTGRAQLEHPAFRLVSPQRPRKRTDNTAPCHGTPATLPSRCGNSWMGSIRNHSGFQTFVNDRSVALSPAHQKQGPFPPPTLLGLHGYMTLSDFRAGHHPIGDV
jgi:hypothetical protein